MHLSLKSVLLYVGMISFFILSFVAISRYGNHYLQAPPNISGEYELLLNNPPTCLLETTAPVLVIGQSGRYLNAELLSSSYSSDELNQARRGNGQLAGEVAGTELTLKGQSLFHQSHPDCTNTNPITIQATLDQNGLSGNLIQANQTIPFVALPVADK